MMQSNMKIMLWSSNGGLFTHSTFYSVLNRLGNGTNQRKGQWIRKRALLMLQSAVAMRLDRIGSDAGNNERRVSKQAKRANDWTHFLTWVL